MTLWRGPKTGRDDVRTGQRCAVFKPAKPAFTDPDGNPLHP